MKNPTVHNRAGKVWGGELKTQNSCVFPFFFFGFFFWLCQQPFAHFARLLPRARPVLKGVAGGGGGGDGGQDGSSQAKKWVVGGWVYGGYPAPLVKHRSAPGP